MNSTKKSDWNVWLIDIIIIIIGCFIYSISINCFTDPNDISPGGVTGIGQLVGDLTGFPKGLFCNLINFPIFLWAFAELNWKGLIKNLFSTFALNIMIDATAPYLPIYKDNMMIAAILAGVTGGIGLGLIFLRGSATGGTDLLATLTKIYIPHLPVGKILLCFDGTVVGVSAIVYSIKSSDPYGIINGATYAAILIFIMSKIIDTMMFGSSLGTGKMVFIMSEKSREISQKIWTVLKRNVTILKSKNIGSNNENEILLSAIKKQEVNKLYNVIKNIDDKAFIMVSDAGEITGDGFKELEKDLERSNFVKKIINKNNKTK